MSDTPHLEPSSNSSDSNRDRGLEDSKPNNRTGESPRYERKPFRGQRRPRAPRPTDSSSQPLEEKPAVVVEPTLEQAHTPSRRRRNTRNSSQRNMQVSQARNITGMPLAEEPTRSSENTTLRPPLGKNVIRDQTVDTPEQRSSGPSRRRRNPRVRQRTDDPVLFNVGTPLANETQTEGWTGSRRANQRLGKSRNGRPLGRYLMCVHKADDFVQIAVLEGRTLIEHYVSKVGLDPNSIDGNIYLGRVTNVLAGMEAAFVDIGTTKNAVLYRGDVRYDRDDLIEASNREVRIEHLLRPRQVALCQITKNPIGTKGARLTQEVSLPGRFVVLVPNSESYGISKRLPDDERRRLRRVLTDLKPEGFGVIVRTAAEGASADELRRDITQLVDMWRAIEAKSMTAHAPTLLYSEPNVAVRVIREEFNRNYRGVIIDDRDLFDEIHSYVASISPELADRVEYYDPVEQGLPLFELHHVHEQLHKAMDRRVWLPSGGYLVIDRAEALTVIDVNTGKNVGTVSLEETIHQVNAEAAAEIARQLRLRDIGGIIVIDFIDMSIEANKADVMKALKDALSRDKTKTQVFEMSSLGLVEMTRQRVSEGLVEALSDICPTCKGRGMVFMDVDMM